MPCMSTGNDGLSRDLSLARDAYDKGDIELSRAAHSGKAAKEQHKGCWIRAMSVCVPYVSTEKPANTFRQ